ncbi:MAG: UDP-2,4-diacetamido-2,4,6-trideoxy-beta-L-altropyranose hydrolase [bacterium]|nr:UDP-2,4-diacetamido-2,4,6-trideoxy-beta-L-altropyranose hydrolase [bacterium]
MNVLMLTEGGKNVGFGHVTRCLSLSHAFELHGYTVEFVVNGDDSIRGLLNRRQVTLLDWSQPGQKKRLLSLVKRARIVVVDSYRAGLEMYREISKAVKVPVFLDDDLRLDYPPGIVVNWSIYAAGMDYPKKDGVHYLLGPRYISLRKSFVNVPEPYVKETVSSVMITFGGDDSRNLTPPVLHFLQREYPRLKKTVVIGGAFKNQETIAGFKDARTHFFHSPGGAGMRMIMEGSGIAISSGGQTLFELACVGLPTIAVTVAENQRNNVNGWEKTGFIKNAGFWNDEDLMSNIDVLFKQLLNHEHRARAVEAGRGTVSGNGAEEIIRFIEEEAT